MEVADYLTARKDLKTIDERVCRLIKSSSLTVAISNLERKIREIEIKKGIRYISGEVKINRLPEGECCAVRRRDFLPDRFGRYRPTLHIRIVH